MPQASGSERIFVFRCFQPQAPVTMAPSVEPAQPTQYLQVTGMVTPEVLTDQEEYNEVSSTPETFPDSREDLIIS